MEQNPHHNNWGVNEGIVQDCALFPVYTEPENLVDELDLTDLSNLHSGTFPEDSNSLAAHHRGGLPPNFILHGVQGQWSENSVLVDRPNNALQARIPVTSLSLHRDEPISGDILEETPDYSDSAMFDFVNSAMPVPWSDSDVYSMQGTQSGNLDSNYVAYDILESTEARPAQLQPIGHMIENSNLSISTAQSNSIRSPIISVDSTLPTVELPWDVIAEQARVKGYILVRDHPEPKKRYPCDKCEESFTRRTDAQRHYGTSHADKKDIFYCPVQRCDRTSRPFLHRGDKFNAHLRKHVDPKLFTCTGMNCPADDLTKADLGDHLFRCHGDPAFPRGDIAPQFFRHVRSIFQIIFGFNSIQSLDGLRDIYNLRCESKDACIFGCGFSLEYGDSIQGMHRHVQVYHNPEENTFYKIHREGKDVCIFGCGFILEYKDYMHGMDRHVQDYHGPEELKFYKLHCEGKDVCPLGCGFNLQYGASIRSISQHLQINHDLKERVEARDVLIRAGFEVARGKAECKLCQKVFNIGSDCVLRDFLTHLSSQHTPLAILHVTGLHLREWMLVFNAYRDQPCYHPLYERVLKSINDKAN